MARKILRVGIAGQGRSGYDIHARWLREAPKQYRIVAVCDLMSDRRRQAAKEFGCRTYKTYQQLVADKEIDLLVNSLPSHLHPAGTLAALRGGHNVVCEKPLATQVRDVDRMIAAARKAKRLFAPFQNSRFMPAFVKMQQVIASGVLGEILHARITWSGFARRWDWQTRQELSGGNLNNTGPHPMDHATMLFGPRTPKVFARMASGVGSLGDADDFASVTLYGPGSPVIDVLISSYMAYPPEDRYVISGERGGLAGGPNALRWRYYDPAKAPRQKLMAGWSDNRRYCSEKLPWVQKRWKRPKSAYDDFNSLSRAFYNNVHDVLAKGAKLVVTPAQVRRQVATVQECHRHNRLPKRKR